MVDHERRTDQRIQPQGARVEFPELQPRLRDLSLSGAYIEDPRPLSRGRMLRMKIVLSETVTIAVRAMVRRVDEGKGMSVEFLEINATDRKRLRDFVGSTGETRLESA